MHRQTQTSSDFRRVCTYIVHETRATGHRPRAKKNERETRAAHPFSSARMSGYTLTTTSATHRGPARKSDVKGYTPLAARSLALRAVHAYTKGAHEIPEGGAEKPIAHGISGFFVVCDAQRMSGNGGVIVLFIWEISARSE